MITGKKTKIIISTAALLIAPLLLVNSCIESTDPAGATTDAYSEIYTAIEAREKECGHRPDYYLLIPDNPSEYGVRLCSLMIIREECPFHDYPVYCLEMTGVDIPGIGP